jgi:hypothetical protein
MKLVGIFDTRLVLVDGQVLDPAPSQLVWNHSPDGFNWGYAGSGPAQLALGILLWRGLDAERAVRLHQLLKFEFIQHLPQRDFDIEFNLDAWLAKQDDAAPIQIALTPSELMALKDLVLEHLLCPTHTESYIDVLRGVETTHEDLLRRLTATELLTSDEQTHRPESN